MMFNVLTVVLGEPLTFAKAAALRMKLGEFIGNEEIVLQDIILTNERVEE